MSPEQRAEAMDLLGLTDEPAMERGYDNPDGSGGASFYDESGRLLGSVVIDSSGNVSLP
tara:strand:+ start:215 stop:391 length:177 start_codon:yes stop_codon:yes gene_type:complete